jgi:molecular chaperone HscB
MNYFELFGLPIGFQVDTKQLRAAFMEIQKASHPDKFAQGSTDEQEAALEQSSLANKGFTLLNQKERILPYVLELLGIMTPDEKYALEPDFLMEMMDLNEAWMDAEDDSDKQAIIQQVEQIKKAIYAPIQTYMEMDQVDTISQEAMLQIKDYYYKKKYLDRILEDFHH